MLMATVVAVLLPGCDSTDNHWDAFDPEQKVVSVSADTLDVVEGGAVDTLYVRLHMVPSDTVRVSVTSPSGQIAVTPSEAVFAPVDDDWTRIQSLAVSAVNDDVDEDDTLDALTVTAVSGDGDYDGQGGADWVPVRVTDNDGAGVYISESALTLVESEDAAIHEHYRVHLLSAPTAAVTVQTAIAPVEPTFHLEPAELTFDADNWDVEQEIRLWIELDEVDNDNLDLVVSHTAVSADSVYANLPEIPSVEVYVFDNTLPPLARLRLVTVEADTLREETAGDGAVVEITLDKPSTTDVIVHLQTAGLTATSDADFVAVDQDVVFAVGAPLSQQFTLNARDDGTLEPVESFDVRITAVDNAIIGDNDILVFYLLDDDTTELTITAVPVTEDSGSLDVVLTLPHAELVPVPFTLVTSDGTALAGSDYEAVSESYVMMPGEVQRTIPVVLFADPDHEPDETFHIDLQDLPRHVQWTQGTVTTTILNDDPQAITLDDIEVVEGDGNAIFTLEMEAPYEHPVTLTVSTLDGDGLEPAGDQIDAIGGSDFTAAASATWIVPAGATTSQFTVSLVADADAEASAEYFRLVIDAADESGFAGLESLCTLLDDDQPCLAVNDVETDESAATALFTVELRDAADNPVTSSADVTFLATTMDQTATAGLDYVAVNEIVTVSAGSATVDIPVILLDDGFDDDQETFVLVLGDPANAAGSCASNHAFCTLLDDEYPALGLWAAATRLNEGSDFVFSVRLSAPRQYETTYQLTLSAGTSDGLGVDYDFSATVDQTIAPFDTEAVFTAPFLDDQLHGEPVEQIEISITAANVALGVTSLTAEIVDAPELTIAAASALEGESALFDVSLDESSTADIRFNVQFASDTAVRGVDFSEAGTGPFTVPAGALGTTVAVPLYAGDGGDWTTEEFIVTLITPTNATVSPFNSAVGTITDTDPSPLSWSGPALANEGADVIFEVALGWASNADIQFSVLYADGTANRAGIDYDDADAGPFTIPAGAMTFDVHVPTTADGDPELAVEDFTITLDSPLHAVLGAPTTAVGTILDLDQPELTIVSSGAVSEGDDASFVVSLSEQTIVPVTFSLVFDHGSTQGAGDYDTTVTGPFTLTPSQTSITITVATVEDAVHENQEVFIVDLAADPVNAVLGTPDSANGVINDDDP